MKHKNSGPSFKSHLPFLALAPLVLSLVTLSTSSVSLAWGVPGVIELKDGGVIIGNSDTGGSIGPGGTEVHAGEGGVSVDPGTISGFPGGQVSIPQGGTYNTPRPDIGVPSYNGNPAAAVAPLIYIQLSYGLKTVENNQQAIQNFFNDVTNRVEETLENNRATFFIISRFEGCIYTACYSERRLQEKRQEQIDSYEEKAQQAMESAKTAYRNDETEKYKKRLNQELKLRQNEISKIDDEIDFLNNRIEKDKAMIPILTSTIDQNNELAAIGASMQTRSGAWDSAVRRFNYEVQRLGTYDSKEFAVSLENFSQELVDISKQQSIEISDVAAQALPAIDFNSLVRMKDAISTSLNLNRSLLKKYEKLQTEVDQRIEVLKQKIEAADNE